jgi:hypothetical protein
LNTYQTKDVTIRAASEPAGRFVQMQIAIMMKPEHAVQLVEAVRALNMQIPGDADPARSNFIDQITRELANSASHVVSGK